MRTLLLAMVGVALCGCPNPMKNDGGTGGGFGGGLGGGIGGGTGSGGGTGGGTVTAMQFCNGYANAICDFATRCGVFDTRMGCDALIAQSNPSEFLCAPALPALNDGRQTFDGTAAGSCLSQLNSGCAFPASCSGNYFTGTVPLDGGCYAEADCAANSFCDSTQMVCPGRCQAATAGPGAIVMNSQLCRDDTYAKNYRDGGFFGYQCVTPGGVGALCSGSGECAFGFICNEDTGQCETPRAQNAVCSFSDGGIPQFSQLCQTFLSCRPEMGGTRSTCQSPGATGELCYVGTFGSCRYDLRCVSSDGGMGGTCAALAGQGVECSSSNDCQRTLFCKRGMGTTRTCEAPGGVGSECDGTSTSCQSGLSCNFMLPTDGGFTPDYRCVASDGGTQPFGCVDPTP